MNIHKAASIYSILMGTALLGTWIVLFLTGGVPELTTSPFETIFLLVAEILTGASLIWSGYGVLAGKKWGASSSLVALGMLLYCSINYSGVLWQQSNVVAAIFMGCVALAAAAFTGAKLYPVSQ